MRNLLQNEDQKVLHREYILRLAVVILVFLFFTLTSGVIFLFPSYFISQVKEDIIQSRAEITERSIAVREQEASATALLEAKQKVALLQSDRNLSLVTQIFETIVTAKPDDVSLFKLSFRELQDQNNEMVVSGIALRRETLLLFRRALEDNVLFETVDLPISNLASDQNIEFSIRITGTF